MFASSAIKVAMMGPFQPYIAVQRKTGTVKPRFSERQNSGKPLFSERFKADQISVLVLCNLQNSEKPLFCEQITADQTVH